MKLVLEHEIAAGRIDAVAIDPSGELVACAGEPPSNLLAVWHVERGKRVWGTDDIVPTQGRSRLAWSSDGKQLAVACGDSTIRLFDERGKRVALLGPTRKKGGGAMTVAFAPGDELVVSGGFDGIARVWEVASGKQLRKLSHGGKDYINSVSVSGGIVATGGQNAEAKLWELATGKLRATVAHGPAGGWIGKVETAAFSPDGAQLATAGGGSSRHKEDRWIRLWNADGSELAKLVGTKGENLGLAFVANRMLAALSFNPDNATTHGDLKLWDTTTHKVVFSIEAPSTAYSLAASATAGRVVVGRTGFTGYEFDKALGGIQIWKLRA